MNALTKGKLIKGSNLDTLAQWLAEKGLIKKTAKSDGFSLNNCYKLKLKLLCITSTKIPSIGLDNQATIP